MKAFEEELKELFRSAFKGIEGEGENCPDIYGLMVSFTDEMTEEKKIELVDHLAECDPCQWKFDAIKQVLKECKALAHKYQGTVLSQDEVKELKKRAEERIAEIEPRLREKRIPAFSRKIKVLFWPDGYRKWLPAAAGLLILILGSVLILRVPQNMEQETLRGQNVNDIELVLPKGTLTMTPYLFQWNAYPGALRYEVRVMDEELTNIWTSDTTEKNEFIIPPDIQKCIIPEKTYFWKIIVYLEDGTLKESAPQEFRIAY
ncbi:MAG: hypothetical protein JXB23_11845 [Candidatus Aminicenantes bacterium]|nr:hypothetical protein [Candidatus Aminicenantes bacterium]